jgi:EF-hand domain pair/EF hand
MNNVLRFVSTVAMLSFAFSFAIAHDPAEAFKMMDADNNGKISKAENEAAADTKFTKADANQDGILKKGELTSFMMDEKGKSAMKAEKKADKKISMFDENGDGELTKDEMMKGSRAMFDTWDSKPKDGRVDMTELKEAYARKM